ncbi:MAG: BT_3928 family protein [Chitinophagaceae bacterium]
MKLSVSTLRLLVGLLFILSGLVKANDPLGLAYKMQEFFEVWNADLASGAFFAKNVAISFFRFLHQAALPLSITMITLEIVAGVALLLGWQKRAVLWLLLVLIVFFTFLTGYAWASGKFKNCGCFGDCLPITPLTSFIKDVALLLAILFLFFNQKYIQPIFAKGTRMGVMAAALLGTLLFQWYVLAYNPVVDCLPFKQGVSITEGMKIPATAVPDSFAIRFVYTKEGKQYEFSPENLPADLDSYEFVERTDKLIRKGNAEPPIKGFALSGYSNIDSTNIVLQQPLAVLFFINGQQPIGQKEKETFEKVYRQATAKNFPVHIITNGLEGAAAALPPVNYPKASHFKIDYTTFKTAARTNPSIYLLKKGTIVNKWSGKKVEEALSQIGAAQP